VSGNVRVGVRVGNGDVGSGVSVGPASMVRVGVCVGESMALGLGVAVVDCGVGVSAPGVGLTVCVGVSAGEDDGDLVSCSVGVVLGVSPVAFPIALTTAGRSAADRT